MFENKIKNNVSQERDINLIDLVIILWKDKWKITIITLISLSLFVYYSKLQTIYYEITTSIKNANPSSFIKYTTLNKTVLSNYFTVTKDFKSMYLLEADSIFKFVINEFLDYEEVIYVLKKDPLIKKKLNNLNGDALEKELANYAKQFQIVAPITEGGNYNLFLKWHNEENGKKIFEEALSISLSNVKKNIVNDLNQLAASIDKINQLKLSKLKNSLKNLENFKEIDAVQLKKGSAALFSYESEYFNIKYEMGEVINDFTSQQLIESIYIIEKDNEKSWVTYNFNFADVNSNKKSLIYIIIIGLGVGLVIGSFLSFASYLVNYLKNTKL